MSRAIICAVAALCVAGCEPSDVRKEKALAYVAPVAGQPCRVIIMPKFGGPQYLASIQGCEP